MRIVIIHDTDSNETFVYEDGNEISGGLRKIKFEHEAGKKADLYYGFNSLCQKKQENSLLELYEKGNLLDVLGVKERK